MVTRSEPIIGLEVRHVQNMLGGWQTTATYTDSTGAYHSANLLGQMSVDDAEEAILRKRRAVRAGCIQVPHDE